MTLVMAGTAAADSATACNGPIGSVTIQGNLVAHIQCHLIGTHVTGNVTVEGPGGSLELSGARIDGNVQAQAGSRSSTESGTIVGGDEQCNHCMFDDIYNSTVQGNVQQVGPVGTNIRASAIGGNLHIQNGTAGFGFLIDYTQVGGNLVFNNNDGVPIVISANTITGNLECQGNLPPPTDVDPFPPGGPNTAHNKLGQCADL
jgi:hypothetical protein